MREYRLFELVLGRIVSDERFRAPDDAEALARVRDVVETEEYELWRGDDLVERQEPGRLAAAG